MTSFKRLAAIATLRCFMATVAFVSPAQAGVDFGSNAATRTLTEDMVQPIHAGMTATEVLEAARIELARLGGMVHAAVCDLAMKRRSRATSRKPQPRWAASTCW